MPENEDLARRLRILSSETRIRLLQLLSEHPYCVGALAEKLGISAGAISQNLKILRQAGLVKAEKRGYYLHYSVVNEALVEFKSTVETFLASIRDQLDGQSKTKGGSQCPRAKKQSARSRRS
jgi:DNA-binding transcriptional ArsR family regulator